MLRAFRTQPRIVRVQANSPQFALAKRQLQSQPRQFRLRLLVPMLRRINLAFRNLLLRAHFLQRQLSRTEIRNQRLQRSTSLFAALLQLRDLPVQRPQFPLHPQRSRLIRPSAGYHAPLVTSSIRRHKRVLRIFTRQLFRRRRAVR